MTNVMKAETYQASMNHNHNSVNIPTRSLIMSSSLALNVWLKMPFFIVEYKKVLKTKSLMTR